MIKYPSIEQFRNVIRRVKERHGYQGRDENDKPIYQHKENYPTLDFLGTVKLHGTNAAIVNYGDRLEFQSRSRVLSLDQDNAGFMELMSDLDLDFLFKDIQNPNDHIAVYGEWCGGNIQKVVAINGLDKMFVIFGVMVDNEWIELDPNLHNNEIGIYNVLQFKTFKVSIDFNSPESVQNDLIDMTNSVEELCPVGEFFGVDGIGEGIVFTCISNQDLKFKSKGEKHSVTKVKKLNAIDTEMMNSINEFVESTVTENRLKQGLSYFDEMGISIEPKNTGRFLSWIVKDVLKEESDTIESSELNEKKVKNAIVGKARVWYLNSVG